MNGYLFERCMVTLVCKLVEENFPSHTEFAKRVFGDSENPSNAWRYIRNGQKGKPKRLGVEDAFNMACALGMDLETLCWKVHRELKEGWSLSEDIYNLEQNKPGRPRKNDKKSDNSLPLLNSTLLPEKNLHQ